MPRKELTMASPDQREDGSIQVEVTLPVRQSRRESSLNQQTGPVSNLGSLRPVPRIARLMALAIKFQGMVDCGEVRDYADLARLGYVTRARVTQLMNLLLLAPDIQEQLLFLPATGIRLGERHLREVVQLEKWKDQRVCFGQIPVLPHLRPAREAP